MNETHALERNPAYIAQQTRFLRKVFRLTQENLAEAAGLTTRTIEKLESGRHRPNEQTLRSIVRACNIELRYFDQPKPEEEKRQEAELERAVRKMVLVPTRPLHTAGDFLQAFGQRHAFRIDTSAVKTDAALQIAAAMGDWIGDLDDVWDECPMSQRLEYARSFIELCQQIEEHGYLCHMGMHKQRLCETGRPDLVFEVGLMSIQKKEGGEGTRYALVHLEGRWETLEEDRAPLPPDFLDS